MVMSVSCECDRKRIYVHIYMEFVIRMCIL